jgi:hypothetical protein
VNDPAPRIPVRVMNLLTPEKAFIFRITHLSNLPWILGHGLHSATSAFRDPGYVEIGNPDLIEKRRRRLVPVAPGGTLSDYVPFYFAPTSRLLWQIKTGRNGIRRRPISELVVLVTSLPTLAKAGVPFVFTDQHASLMTAAFFTSLADLPRLEWRLWQTHDVERDLRDLDRPARYVAEALACRHVPISALHSVACYGDDEQRVIEEMVRRASARVEVWRQPEWFL